MPNIPGLSDELQALSGVQMTPPPAELIPSITQFINQSVASLPEGEKGRIVWIAQKHGNEKSVNLAIVSKLGGHAEVTGWVGKSWGTPYAAGLVAGAAGAVHW
jgi:hypothetical protein